MSLMDHAIDIQAIGAGVGSLGSDLALPWFLKEDDISGLCKGVEYSMADVVSFVNIKREE